MIIPEMFALADEVFITNAVIYPDDTIENYELRAATSHTGYASLRFQYENIIIGWDHIATSEEFGAYCSGLPMGRVVGVAVYGVPLKEQK